MLNIFFRLFLDSFLIRTKKRIVFLARWFELSCIFIQLFSYKLTYMVTLLDLNSHFGCPEFPVNNIWSTGPKWKIVHIVPNLQAEFLKFSVEQGWLLG